ncbi:MAG: thiamine-phosphate kinase, partial [Aromatoleum sp.]|nr:thiamine-phosphate kinase [Aromatoleum sp.]
PRGAALAGKLHGAERALALDCLLAGGDDYELCFTAPPTERGRLAALARELGMPLTRIGTITAGGGLVVRDENGAMLETLPRAFDHFAGAAA